MAKFEDGLPIEGIDVKIKFGNNKVAWLCFDAGDLDEDGSQVLEARDVSISLYARFEGHQERYPNDDEPYIDVAKDFVRYSAQATLATDDDGGSDG